jgi:stage IV sporulation protein FB
LVVVFVAILLHECGHALAARYFGQQPQIELHAMGGVTTWTWVDHLRWWNRVVISLAGPVAGFILGAVVWAVTAVWPPESLILHYARYQFLWVSFGWGAFNLLPLLPLDGGHVMCEYLEHKRGRDQGRVLARKVSIATGVAGLALGVAADEAWAGLLCGIFAFDNYQRMQGLPGVKLPA